MNDLRARVYLDHNATAPLRPEAARAIAEVFAAPAGNASSLHREGRHARARIEAAREEVAAFVGAPAREVVFTSGGSESIAAAVHGACARAGAERRRIVVSAIEHSAVLAAASAAGSRGFETIVVPCGRDGAVDPDAFARRLDDRVALAALQHANPETGVVQPVGEVGRACRERGIVFLVDAVQSAGKIPLDRDEARLDLLAISAHKLGGPQGAGALVVREGTPMAPLVVGGAQERRRRGGTEATALLAGFGAAAAAARRDLAVESARLASLRERIERTLRDDFPEVRIHGRDRLRLANTVLFAIPGVPGETLVIALDLLGFALSTGSACASGATEPSHVLLAMGVGDEEARGAVRISMGWSTDSSSVDALLDALPGAARGVREALARRS